MNFKKQRELANLTQSAVAEALDVQRTTVSMWETGDSLPNPRLLPAIAKLYHCTVDELLADAEPEPSEESA